MRKANCAGSVRCSPPAVCLAGSWRNTSKACTPSWCPPCPRSGPPTTACSRSLTCFALSASATWTRRPLSTWHKDSTDVLGQPRRRRCRKPASYWLRPSPRSEPASTGLSTASWIGSPTPPGSPPSGSPWRKRPSPQPETRPGGDPNDRSEQRVPTLPAREIHRRLAGLRRHTAPHHKVVAASVDIVGRLSSADRYVDLLARLHGFSRPLEAQVARAVGQWDLPIDV